MDLWFYIIDGQQYGPVEEQKITDMLASGALSPDSLGLDEGPFGMDAITGYRAFYAR